MLDGLRLYTDITFADNWNQKFYALPDGSCLYGKDGTQELRGQVFLVRNGAIREIQNIGERMLL